MTLLKNISHNAERKVMSGIIDKGLRGIEKDREKEFLKIIDVAKKFYGDRYEDEDYERFKTAVKDPDNRWMKFINRVIDESDYNVLKGTALNLGYESFLRGTKLINQNRKKYQCNIPWLILFDPTDACNMHCVGCWSGTYGHKHNLSFEDMDRIVTEGKELGVHLYMMTGGEPLVRKADILKLAKKHNDCFFSLYTNSSLIDEELCRKVVELGNITFQLSIEGTPETNDSRRGIGHYEDVMNAMDLLKNHGIIFGTSICYTRDNVEAVTSDEFLNMIADKGARFGFYFHYMPVGKNAAVDLIPTCEQREYMIDRIRYIRSDKSDIQFFPMDFQNDGEYTKGCIAGGRNYFHINSAGDAEPCVFIHYSDSNIHDKSILEILQSPLFMAYRDGQPFNDNHLRPCPMLENPKVLEKMVSKTNAHNTNYEGDESAEELCSKCYDYAEKWKPFAESRFKQ